MPGCDRSGRPGRAVPVGANRLGRARAGAERPVPRRDSPRRRGAGLDPRIGGRARRQAERVSTGFADYQQTFTTASQAISDTHAYPSRDRVNCPDVAATYPTCLTDTQLQTELKRLIATGLAQGTATNAPLYFIVTPGTVNICANASTWPTLLKPGSARITRASPMVQTPFCTRPSRCS
jgi:hypothetical protein